MLSHKFWASLKFFPALFLTFLFSANSLIAQEEFYRDYLEDHPVDQVYIHTDKDVFFLDTEIQFKAYVKCSRQDIKPSEEVNILILNFRGDEVYRGSFPLSGGTASGSIRIDPEWDYGEYSIKSYTKRSLRSAYPGLFERKILVRDYRIPSLRIHLELAEPVYSPGDFGELEVVITLPNGKPAKLHTFEYSFLQNGSVYRFGESTTDKKGRAKLQFQIPEDEGFSLVSAQVSSDFNGVFHSNSIVVTTSNWPVLLSFFPEGGRLVEGFESDIVFSATNVFKEPIMIKADLIDDYGKKIGEITTDYPGLGSFKINPDIGNPLIVKLTEPYETFREFPLPEIQDEGIIMKILGSGDDRSVIIDHNYDLESIPAKLLAESGGIIIWEKEFEIDGELKIDLPLSDFPDGLFRISLLSDDFGLLAQRPILVSNHTKFLNGELTVAESSIDAKGKLVLSSAGTGSFEGNLSVSVVDDLVCPDLMINPDIYSSFVLGQSVNHSPFPSGFTGAKDSVSQVLLDMFVSTRLNTNIFYEMGIPDFENKSDEEILQKMLDEENPGAMEQLLSVLRADLFMQEYILDRGNEIAEFLDHNHNKLEELEMIPGQMTEDEIVSRLLERGTPLLNIVKAIQPVWSAGELIYFRSPTSINYQPPALIFVDGIKRGASRSALAAIDPYTVDSLRVHTTIADILKFGSLDAAGGIIDIVTKKGNTDVEEERFILEDFYDPTLFWLPDFNSKIDPEFKIDLPYPKLRTNYRLVVQGVDENGNPIYFKSDG